MKSFRDWVKRHRRSLLVSAGVAGVVYVLYRSIKPHYARVMAEIQERESHAALLREANERVEAQLQSHFESIQRISDAKTLPTVLPRLKSQLFSQVDISGLTDKLLQGKESPQALTAEQKMQLWQKLKISSFTRTTCAMWALTLLNLFVRVQLNILARHVYMDTARDISISKLGDQSQTVSLSCQHLYIAFANFLPQRGLDYLILDTKRAVESVLMSKPLKEPCTLTDLREIFTSIRVSFESSQVNWLHYVLPEDNALPDDVVAADATRFSTTEVTLHDDDAKLDQLIVETRAVLSSKEFGEVLASSFEAVLDGLMEEFNAIYQGGTINSVPLAKLLPPVASVGTLLLLEIPDENKFIRIIGAQQQLQSFCAMVYSAAGES